MKFSNEFERDYNFYLENKDVFTFSGSDAKKTYGIQLPGEKGTFAIPYSEQGKSAKICFHKLDGAGKKVPCSEPQLLIEILTCKGSLNLNIKTWAQSRSEYTLSKGELSEMMISLKAPEWVFKAVENQKDKIIKDWIKTKKYLEHSFYAEAVASVLLENDTDDIEILDEPDPNFPVEQMTKESLMAVGVSESKAEFMMAVANGEIDGSCVVKNEEENGK
jgi:hypothetical protein